MSNNSECAKFFKSRPEYKRCFLALRKKWESYGRAAGRITLTDAPDGECRAIGGIVGRAWDAGTIRFSVAEFEAGLQRTRFAPVALGEVLACYFGEEISTNQEQRRREQEQKAGFFEELIACFEEQPGEMYGSGSEDASDFSVRISVAKPETPGRGGRHFAVAKPEAFGHGGKHYAAAKPQSDGRGTKQSAAAEWLRCAAETKRYGYHLLVKEHARDAEGAGRLARAVGRALNLLVEEGMPGVRADSSGEFAVGKTMDEENTGEAVSGGKRDKTCDDLAADGIISGMASDRTKDGRVSENVVGKGQMLAVFAAGVSGNPHYFDRGTAAGQLLVHAVCFYQGRALPQSAHAWRELMLGVGIVPDALSSSVHALGLRLRTADGYHPAYEAFCARREPCVITLENLQGVVGVDVCGDCVYVVENEMVFSFLTECTRERAVTILCTSGQPRTAALELFSLLAAAHIRIYYSGDIDPEGIDIADRLWQQYKDSVSIWRMAPSDYGKSMSAERIDAARLAKLKHIRHPALLETAACVREKECAGYQENLLGELAGDVTGGVAD